MQKTGGQRNRDQRGSDMDTRDNRDTRDRTDKDGFRSSLPRPDISALKRDIASHDKDIANCNKELAEIKIEQDKARNARNGGRHEFDTAKKANSKLLNTKKKLHDEKSAIEASREASYKKIMACQDKEKAAKAEIKLNSVDAIDKKIKELENRQAHTSMSLTEEKNLVKEIKGLNLSKRNFAALQELKAVTDKERAVKSGIDKQFAEKNAELKALYKKIDAQKIVLDALNKSSNECTKHLPALKKRQDELEAQIVTENVGIKALRVKIKEKEDLHAVDVAEEKKKWKEEQAEVKRKLEAEELAKHPYEEEMFICDFLITYLSAKCSADSKTAPSSSEAAASTTSVDTSSFAGMKSLKRDDDETFMAGPVKKKNKKKGGQNSKDDITHTHESLEHFSSIGATPPAKLSSVSESLKELQEKKEYFNALERGSIPSLKTLRAKQNKNGNTSTSDGNHSKKNDKKTNNKSAPMKSVFNMDSQAEYPGL